MDDIILGKEYIGQEITVDQVVSYCLTNHSGRAVLLRRISEGIIAVVAREGQELIYSRHIKGKPSYGARGGYTFIYHSEPAYEFYDNQIQQIELRKLKENFNQRRL